MSCQTFHRVAGSVFALVALAHGARAALQMPVTAGDGSVPMWVSWVAVVVAGGLSYWAFASAPRGGS